MSDTGRIAGVELGGTKVIALLWQDGTALDELRVPTRDPDFDVGRSAATAAAVVGRPSVRRAGDRELRPRDAGSDAAGLRLHPDDAEAGLDRARRCCRDSEPHFACPMAIETDVNAAALAEYRWGHGQGADSLVYLTLGTGVGGGVLSAVNRFTAASIPELGHLLLRRAPGDTFAGDCPFHRDCVEGLLSGPALHARFGADAPPFRRPTRAGTSSLDDLAQFLTVIIHSLAPNRILIGGGVGMGAPWLIERAPALVLERLGGYYPEIDIGALAD